MSTIIKPEEIFQAAIRIQECLTNEDRDALDDLYWLVGLASAAAAEGIVVERD